MNTRHLAPSGGPGTAARARGPGAWSGLAVTVCAVSRPARLRAPSVPGPFAAAGRAVRCRDGTFDPDRPRHPALRASGRPAGLDRGGPRLRPPHPAPVPRPACRRTERRRRFRRRHQRTTAPTAQPRSGVVVRDHDQPQPGRPLPAHAVTVRPATTSAHPRPSGERAHHGLARIVMQVRGRAGAGEDLVLQLRDRVVGVRAVDQLPTGPFPGRHGTNPARAGLVPRRARARPPS